MRNNWQHLYILFTLTTTNFDFHYKIKYLFIVLNQLIDNAYPYNKYDEKYVVSECLFIWGKDAFTMTIIGARHYSLFPRIVLALTLLAMRS